MKRIALLCMGLALGAATAAEAQLTMQMSNGWNFTFSGNVNAFLTYEHFDDEGATGAPGVLVPSAGDDETRIRTGLLPAFAVFDAKGKEGETDLSVHFGFAPQIQCGTGVHDCFGAQIDMRQVFLTVGGTWGQILAGRELGLFGRQNILTDQTLFGVGGTGSAGVSAFEGGGGGGTTLGRIGYGYVYPQFKAQMTYSSPAGRPFQLSVGLFEAGAVGFYDGVRLPRVEAEGVWSQGNTKVWVGGLLQSTKNDFPGFDEGESATAYGASGGVRFGSETFSLTGSGYYGKGIGTTLMFNEGACVPIDTDDDGDADLNATCGDNGTDDLRDSYGFIGQVTFTPAGSKVTVAGSYGTSWLKSSDTDEAAGGIGAFKTENTLISGGLYYQATKSLKVVGEFNYTWSKESEADADKNQSFAPAFGLMLFF